MITELRVPSPDRACVWWWSSIKALSAYKKFKFASGLNLLVGENGTGKSTIITAMARMLHCEQGGVQKVTRLSLNNVTENNRKKFLNGVYPVHDGAPVIFGSPDHAPGLMPAVFDDNFTPQGMRNLLFRGSSGETSMKRLNLAMLIMLNKEKTPPFEWGDGVHINERIKKFLLGNEVKRKRGKKISTILVDEPDRSLDMNHQLGWWVTAARAAKHMQIIAAAHSPIALLLPDTNIIELTPGFAELIRTRMKKLTTTDKLAELIEAG